MKPLPKIRRAFTRLYSDNRQLSAYVEWSDGARTEGRAIAPLKPAGTHMEQLFARATREGMEVTHEQW
ncbi:MAG: hypothetical protein AB7I52_17455 [Rhizobiaceae bacterium]